VLKKSGEQSNRKETSVLFLVVMSFVLKQSSARQHYKTAFGSPRRNAPNLIHRNRTIGFFSSSSPPPKTYKAVAMYPSIAFLSVNSIFIRQTRLKSK